MNAKGYLGIALAMAMSENSMYDNSESQENLYQEKKKSLNKLKGHFALLVLDQMELINERITKEECLNLNVCVFRCFFQTIKRN
jgi:hypothetical protein